MLCLNLYCDCFPIVVKLEQEDLEEADNCSGNEQSQEAAFHPHIKMKGQEPYQGQTKYKYYTDSRKG